MKLWRIDKRKMVQELPGHEDEVWALDWAPDGQRIVSGGKDRIVKLWRG